VCFGGGNIDVNSVHDVSDALKPMLPEAEVLAAVGHDWNEAGRVSRRLRFEDDLSSGQETLQRCHVRGSIRRS
jgi:hypothetical protein